MPTQFCQPPTNIPLHVLGLSPSRNPWENQPIPTCHGLKTKIQHHAFHLTKPRLFIIWSKPQKRPTLFHHTWHFLSSSFCQNPKKSNTCFVNYLPVMKRTQNLKLQNSNLIPFTNLPQKTLYTLHITHVKDVPIIKTHPKTSKPSAVIKIFKFPNFSNISDISLIFPQMT